MIASPASGTGRGGGLLRYRRLPLGIVSRPYLLLMLFVTIRSSFAARTPCRAGSAAHEAVMGGHREGSRGFKVKAEL